jgi:hypothetical protein
MHAATVDFRLTQDSSPDRAALKRPKRENRVKTTLRGFRAQMRFTEME